MYRVTHGGSVNVNIGGRGGSFGTSYTVYYYVVYLNDVRVGYSFDRTVSYDSTKRVGKWSNSSIVSVSNITLNSTIKVVMTTKAPA